jgi:5-methyltetrahydropteroyltriglutamate--homocysteine methyltransferase
MCFGYAYVVSEKPAGYEFLGELNDTCVTAISIEAAQPGLDPAMLKRLPDKHVLFGVLNLGSMEAETPELVAERLRAALPYIDAERLIAAPDCGMKYLPRSLAFAKLKALADGARIVREEVRGKVPA